jgi:hypothetical protein
MGLGRHTGGQATPAPARAPEERIVPVLVGIWGLGLYVFALDYFLVQGGALDEDQRWRWVGGLIAAVASVVSIAVVSISPHRLRRGMLLALCLSLALNLSLMIGLSHVRIAAHRPTTSTRVEPLPRDEPTLPEYVPLDMSGEDRPQQPERQPVTAGEPELEPREFARTPSMAAAIPLPERAESMPEPRPRPSTAIDLRQELVESAPRRFEWQSTLSRQTLTAEPILGRADADIDDIARESVDLEPHEAASELARQASASPERPALDERALSTETSPSPPLAVSRQPSADDVASARPPTESLATVEPLATAARSLETRPSVSPSTRVDSLPRPEDQAEDSASPPSPRLTRQATAPAVASESDVQMTASTPRLEPPDAARAEQPSPAPSLEPLQRATRLREPASASVDVARELVDLPRAPLGDSQASEPDDTPHPSPGASSLVARQNVSASELPADDSARRPMELGVAPATRPLPVQRVARREQPEVPRPASERMSTSRSLSGDARPALRNDVERPDIAVRASRSDAPTAASLSVNEVHDGESAAVAAPEVLPSASPSVLPPTPHPPALARSTGTSRAEDGSPTDLTSPAPALPRSETLGSARPLAPGTSTAVPPVARDSTESDVGNEPALVARPAVTGGAESRSLSTAETGATAASPATGPPETRLAGSATPLLDRRSTRTGEDAPRLLESAAGAAGGAERAPLAAPPMVDRTVAPQVRQADGQAGGPVRPDSLISGVGDGSATRSQIARRSTGAIPVDVDVVEAAGGLSNDLPHDIGLTHRQAQPESQQVADNVGRFLRRPLSGPPSIDSQVPIPARAYQTRMNRQGEAPAGGKGRPSPRTEEAIELGLSYLANQQREDGSWRLARDGETTPNRRPLTVESDSAASGLALLSFLGAGYHHRSDKYGHVVRAGLEYLITHQQENGDLFIPADSDSNRSAWLYSHAIASIALCEAFGMTQDPALRRPAQRAVDFIIQTQHPRRGGWRYEPRIGSDTSVSGWMVMAMRSAELANLVVPNDAWGRVETWLDLAQLSEARPELYRYNPLAPNTISQGHGRRVTKSMTAVGLLMRMYTGWHRDDRQMVAGADYLLNNLPESGSARDPQRDTYYWYYATQVMFHMRGQYWERWNGQLHDLLTSTQEQVGPLAGSWDPWSPSPDRWAPHAGRIYVTTMNLLSLEVYYRHLPIYEDTAR